VPPSLLSLSLSLSVSLSLSLGRVRPWLTAIQAGTATVHTTVCLFSVWLYEL
jgi:hypothetical protein